MDKKVEREILKQVISKSIKLKRFEKNITLERLASLTNLDDKHIGRLERGEKLPNLHTLTKLQIALNFTSNDYIPEFIQAIEDHKKN